jgi:hypothetical protein
MADLENAADKDPRLPHMTDPPVFVDKEQLMAIGVLYWKVMFFHSSNWTSFRR